MSTDSDLLSLTDLAKLAETFSSSYASPHHFTMSVEGLRNLLKAVAKQQSADEDNRYSAPPEFNTPEYHASVLEAVRAGRITYAPGWNVPPPTVKDVVDQHMILVSNLINISDKEAMGEDPRPWKEFAEEYNAALAAVEASITAVAKQGYDE